MDMPPELSAPPPRDPYRAEPFLARGKRRAWNLVFVGLGLLAAMVLWARLELRSVKDWWLVLPGIVGAGAVLLGLGRLSVQGRAMSLFVSGQATWARVTELKVSGDGHDGTRTEVTVEFTDGTGKAKGVVKLSGRPGDLGLGIGSALVALSDGHQFAVHAPTQGLHVGRLTR